MKNTPKNSTAPNLKSTVLADGFFEVEGVFLIEAVAKNTFLNRKKKLEELTGFSDGMFDSYQEDEEGGIWKTISQAEFKSVDELKKTVIAMKKYNWLFLSDSSILFEGSEIFCNGRWLI